MINKPGVLSFKWSKKKDYGFDTTTGERGDIEFKWGQGISKSDGHLLFSFINYVKGLDGKTLVEELLNRGYDLTTIRFSIEKKKVKTDGKC